MIGCTNPGVRFRRKKVFARRVLLAQRGHVPAVDYPRLRAVNHAPRRLSCLVSDSTAQAPICGAVCLTVEIDRQRLELSTPAPLGSYCASFHAPPESVTCRLRGREPGFFSVNS